MVSIASVVSDSDSKAWLWFTIPSWYHQIKESGKKIPAKMKYDNIDGFFKEYETYVSKTTPSGGAATLKKHRSWGWRHKDIAGYNAPKLSDWATDHPLSEVGATFEKTEEGDKNVWTATAKWPMYTKVLKHIAELPQNHTTS